MLCGPLIMLCGPLIRSFRLSTRRRPMSARRDRNVPPNYATCQGTTKEGRPCKRKAVAQQFCRTHDPNSPERRMHAVLDKIEGTCRSKGWQYHLDHLDTADFKYATISVSRRRHSAIYETIDATLDLTVDNGVRLASHKTSFHSDGIKDLVEAIWTRVKELPWLEKSRPSEPSNSQAVSASLDRIFKLISGFHRVANQLRHRRANRPTLEITDECDAQDLFHALLCPLFDDIRREDHVPTRGGSPSRVDFLLKNERIVIELKMATPMLADRKIGEQLIVDIERYRGHPDCDDLVCFVHEPDGNLKNPTGLEADLSKSDSRPKVHVRVSPK